MKRKLTTGFLASICLLVLGGCYEPLPLTEDEMDLVAEYAAGVLVEHGTQTTEKLLDPAEQEIALQLSATPTPRPTLPPAKPSPGGTEKDPSGTPVLTPTKVPGNTQETMKDLTRLLDKGDFFFQYTGYQITPVYQGTGEMFAAAGEGKNLIVLEFEITNRASGTKVLEMNRGADKEHIYTLLAGTKAIRPSLTLLHEDMYTSYSAEYGAGETQKGVLVFECSEKEAEGALTLTVLKESDGKEDSVLMKVK